MLGGFSSGLSKADELVCAEVALRLHKPKATIVMCVEATIKICEWALSSGQNFDFVFKDIGVLVCRGNHVAMRFFEDLVREVAQSKRLAEGLLQVSLARISCALKLLGTPAVNLGSFLWSWQLSLMSCLQGIPPGLWLLWRCSPCCPKMLEGWRCSWIWDGVGVQGGGEAAGAEG